MDSAPPAAARTLRIAVMGVSGSGKSTLADALAEHLGLPFVEGDALHSAESIALMSRGEPLTDVERMPWLTLVGAALAAPIDGAVVACSALRRRYRDALRTRCPDAYFVHLDISRGELEARVAAREGHFMPASLLDSQLDTLEALEADEVGIVIRSGTTDDMIAAVEAAIAAQR